MCSDKSLKKIAGDDMMKLTEKKIYIENSIEKVLLPFEFEKEFFRVGKVSTWLFSRETSVKQTIEIMDDGMRINMRFYTNIQMDKIYVGELVLKNSIENLQQVYLGYAYDSEDDFGNIVSRFSDIMVEFGLKELERLSIPKPNEFIIKKEYFFRLKERKEDAVNEFYKKYDNDSSQEQLKIIVNLIESLRGKETEEIIEKLIDLSAIYGEWIISMFGGRWLERENDFVVCDVGPDKSVRIVLRDVFWHFSKKYRINYNKLCERHGKNNYIFNILKG